MHGFSRKEENPFAKLSLGFIVSRLSVTYILNVNPFNSRNPLSIADLLSLVDPSATLKEANLAAHDVTLDDLLDTLVIIKEADIVDGLNWENLSKLVTGANTISQWKGDLGLVKSTCKAKRDQ